MADYAYKQVTCRNCGRTYTCTPGDDYYLPEGEEARPDGTYDGVCTRCLLSGGGLDPERTRLVVMDPDGNQIDPRVLGG